MSYNLYPSKRCLRINFFLNIWLNLFFFLHIVIGLKHAHCHKFWSCPQEHVFTFWDLKGRGRKHSGRMWFLFKGERLQMVDHFRLFYWKQLSGHSRNKLKWFGCNNLRHQKSFLFFMVCFLFCVWCFKVCQFLTFS